MKNVLLMSLCALALAGCNGQPRASRGDCERLRAHAAALEIRAATEHGLGRMDPAAIEAHQGAIEAALGETFVEDCLTRDRAAVDAALGATSSADLSRSLKRE